MAFVPRHREPFVSDELFEMREPNTVRRKRSRGGVGQTRRCDDSRKGASVAREPFLSFVPRHNQRVQTRGQWAAQRRVIRDDRLYCHHERPGGHGEKDEWLETWRG
jgi:hypothetical protein